MLSNATAHPVESASIAAHQNGDGASHAIPEFVAGLSPSELELFSELLRAVRTIRYGSVNLTFHDGRIVEIHRTERIRFSAISREKG